MNLLSQHHRALTAFSVTSLAALGLLASRPSSPVARVSMSTAASLPQSYQTITYKPRHQTWPYSASDLTPQDPSSDVDFYSSPRFVTHIDDHAIETLAKYYDATLPRQGRILDLCSSWISHFPRSLDEQVKKGELEVAGVGMNAPELKANKLLQGKWAVHDLNAEPRLPAMSALFEGKLAQSKVAPAAEESEEVLDSTVCVVSIDYLTSPVRILQSILKNTKAGGTVHLVISNRCFPTKAVGRWLRIDEDERLGMVGDYLWFAGWRDIEVLTLSDGQLEEEQENATNQQGGLQSLMKMLGMSGRCDPLWVVRAKKTDDAASSAGKI